MPYIGNLRIITPVRSVISAKYKDVHTIGDALHTINKVIGYHISPDAKQCHILQYKNGNSGFQCDYHSPIVAYAVATTGKEEECTLYLKYHDEEEIERRKLPRGMTQKEIDEMKKDFLEIVDIKSEKEVRKWAKKWAKSHPNSKIDKKSSIEAILDVYYDNQPHEFFVKSLTGKTITLTAPQNVLVSTVKCLLQDKEGIPLDQQRLIYNGSQLEDERRLDSYLEKYPTNSATISLVFRVEDGESTKDKIVKHLTEGMDKIMVKYNNVTVPLERLDEFIENSKSKKSNSIYQMTLHLVLRLRGGMYNEVSGRDGEYQPLKNILDTTFKIQRELGEESESDSDSDSDNDKEVVEYDEDEDDMADMEELDVDIDDWGDLDDYSDEGSD